MKCTLFLFWVHRIAEVRRDLQSSSLPSKQGQLEQVAQHHGHSTTVLRYPPRWKLQPLLIDLFQCLTAVVILKESNLLLTRNVLYFSLCPLPVVILWGAAERSLAPSSLLSHGVFIHLDKASPEPSLGCTVPALSALLPMSDSPIC